MFELTRLLAALVLMFVFRGELMAQVAPAAIALHSRERQLKRGTPVISDTTARLSLQTSDRWFGRDKAKHFAASLLIQLATYGVFRASGAQQSSAQLGAATLGVAAGVSKEIWDAHGHGDPSVRDLVWDGAGVAVGAGLSALIEHRK